MDILAHSLWSAAVAKAARRKIRVPVWRAIWWGIFPDLASLGPLFIIHGIGALRSGANFWQAFWHTQFEPATSAGVDILTITPLLYSATHSVFFFVACFGISYLLRKWLIPKYGFEGRVSIVPWELFGWLLHIVIDISTHSADFYPTPFLWPFSSVTVNSISWTNPIFAAVNYGTLAAIGIYFYIRWRKKKDSF